MQEQNERERNLIITGFMGTGKSMVARRVAWMTGRPLIDMDAEIEARAGKPIPRIFAEDGERAFRDMEAALCRELSRSEGQVVATGGGALVPSANRCRFLRKDLVICLDADVEEIMRRVGHSGRRPLLDVDDPRTEIECLLSSREEVYAALPWHIDTTDLSLDEVAARVIALAEARMLTTRHPGGAYDIYIGEGMLEHAGGALRAAGVPAASRVALVSNDVVGPLYAEAVEKSLAAARLRPLRCVIPDGERHKCLDTVKSLYDQFLKGQLDRGGVVLSLGGGVTGDIAGFAAATFMRGVCFAQVSTTLLAMVDASVGGKTGVDLPQGKNLVGAFKQPVVVVVDPNVLSTLEWAEIRSGMAEVIKHGVIGAPQLFAELEDAPGGGVEGKACPPLSTDQLARALRVKMEVVEEDPYEQGRRAVLNLGHTVGHALEKLSGFTLRHGEAVSIGMVAAARIAVALGAADGALADRIGSALVGWGLPVDFSGLAESSITAVAVWKAMAHDKKRRGDALRWVLPVEVGQVVIRDDVPKGTVLSVLRQM